MSTILQRTTVTRNPKVLIPRIGVAALFSSLEVGAGRAPEAEEDLARSLLLADCEVVNLGSIGSPDQATLMGKKLAESHVDAVVFAAASWFEDYLALDLLEECSVPVLLWSLPGMETGALCGTQQLTSFLKYLGQPFRCVHGKIGEGECLDRALAFLRASTLKSSLRRSRIGMAGQRVDGMTHASANEFALKKAVGSRLVPLNLPGILARAQSISTEETHAAWEKMLDSAASCQSSDSDGLHSMRIHLALREAVEQHKLSALTVGCYPDLMGSVCLAASLLADEGIPMACEGDANGAVGQLMLTLLTGQPTHSTDWLESIEDGSVIFAHCGSGSFSLAERKEDITLAPVRLVHRGVCALFPAKTGPVTLVSLTPNDSGYQCALLEGEALSTKMVFPGNPVRVRFAQSARRLVEWISDQGISHHWMIGYGHVAAEIREWAAIVGPSLRLIEP